MKRAAAYIIAMFSVLVLAGIPPALAQEEEGGEGGIPVHAVARVKVLDGSVWVRPSDGGEWEEFPSNSPLPPGSRVSVPEGSEAELQFHGGQFVLLTSGTDLEVRDLREETSAFRLRSGEIRFDLPPDDFAPVSVRVPGGALAQFLEPGRHWLTVTENDETLLVVRRGTAVVTVDGDEHHLGAGQEAVIGQDVTIGRYQGGAEEYAEAPPPYEEDAPAVAPPVVVNELRQYGEWIDVPTYGYVWRPRVAVGWSPYVYGRWAWIFPYGWTWVSNEPWGWYPYRCGYWITDPVFGWIWSPYNAFVSVNFVFGSHHYRHHNVYFRPATVRFIPEGRNVRWVPLRPGERFRPVEFRRDDTRLARWNRPLDSGRVFVRGGPDRSQWRDWKAVHTERQVESRKTRAAQPRTDTRTILPEKRVSRPPSSVEGRKTPDPRRKERTGSSERKVGRPERGTGGSREAVPGPGKVDRKAPPPRVQPAQRSERGNVRYYIPGYDRSGVPDRPAERRGDVPERAPAVRSPDAGSRGAVPERAPVVRSPGAGSRGAVPERAPVVRSPGTGSHGAVPERAPVVRSPGAGSRGQEIRGGRQNDSGSRGGDRGSDWGGDRGGGRGGYGSYGGGRGR
ncbi:MAG: hypothetical protein H6R41_119 [Deltaproteobacteria bacterium]|nr:hypothetical protein [Deltaproteobacteria bacterium]MBS1243582.1 hypothetical protein [Deltaproteobacteria bacterium]